jgi:diguanylate cyclase (GGDEF)-like protein
MGHRLWRGWVIGDFLQLALVTAPLLRWAGPSVRRWIDRQFQSPPLPEVSLGRRTAVAHVILATMGVVVLSGIGLLKQSLDLDPEARTQQGALLLNRIDEIQFFLTLLVGAVFVASAVFAGAIARASERQRHLARRDSVTGCFNRRAFYELFAREADRSRRLRHGLTLLFLDVDRFKTINDTLGHEAGDRVLQQLAARLQSAVRETDLVFRWGGEEFIVLAPHTAPADGRLLAERVRAAVEQGSFVPLNSRAPVHVTVSLGAVGTMHYPVDPDELIQAADLACYEAKARGRNSIAEAETVPS